MKGREGLRRLVYRKAMDIIAMRLDRHIYEICDQIALEARHMGFTGLPGQLSRAMFYYVFFDLYWLKIEACYRLATSPGDFALRCESWSEAFSDVARPLELALVLERHMRDCPAPPKICEIDSRLAPSARIREPARGEPAAERTPGYGKRVCQEVLLKLRKLNGGGAFPEKPETEDPSRTDRSA